MNVFGILGGFFLLVIAYGFEGGARTFLRAMAAVLFILGVLPFLQMLGLFSRH